MKTKVLSIAIVAGLFLLVFGWDRTYSYITTGKKIFGKQVDEAMPFFVEIERAQGMVYDLEEAVWEYQEKLAGIQVDIGYLREEISTKEKQLDKDRMLLEQISGLLEKRQDGYFINGKKYSYRDVSDDALDRARVYRSQKECLKTKRDNLRVMEDTARVLEKEISVAQSKKQEFENVIARLRAKHSHIEAKKELAFLSDGINIREFRKNHFVRINQILKNLEKRQERSERLLDAVMGLRASSGRVDYGGSSGDALEEIRSLLSPNS